MTYQVVAQLQDYTQTGTKPWDYKIALIDLSVQIGSLMKLSMQMNCERYAHGLSINEIKEKMGDELADILSLVLFIAHELNIDIYQAWQKMLLSDQEKIKGRQRG